MGTELERVRQNVNDALVPRETAGSPAPWPGLQAPWSPPRGLFTFRYSSTEVFSEGGNLHVKMRETRYEDGRMTSEECEGTIDRQACQQMVNEAQGYFLNQMANFTRLLFAPFSRGRRYDE